MAINYADAIYVSMRTSEAEQTQAAHHDNIAKLAGELLNALKAWPQFIRPPTALEEMFAEDPVEHEEGHRDPFFFMLEVLTHANYLKLSPELKDPSALRSAKNDVSYSALHVWIVVHEDSQKMGKSTNGPASRFLCNVANPILKLGGESIPFGDAARKIIRKYNNHFHGADRNLAFTRAYQETFGRHEEEWRLEVEREI